MRAQTLHQFLEEFERDARIVGQQKLIERIQSIRASADPLDYLRKLLAKEKSSSSFEDSSRQVWFKTFVSPERKRLSDDEIHTLVSITKGWELNDTQVDDLQFAARLWTKRPEFFWIGQEHSDILLKTLENLSRNKEVDPMKRKLWLIITSEFMEKLQQDSPPMQKRISNSDPCGKRVRTGIAKSGQEFVQSRWPDLSDNLKLKLTKNFAKYSNKGWKYRQLKKPSLVLSLNGATVNRFEDQGWTGLLFSALNAWIEKTPQFTIIGDLDEAYKAITDCYYLRRLAMTPIVTVPNAFDISRMPINDNSESSPCHTETLQSHRQRQDDYHAVPSRYCPSSALMRSATRTYDLLDIDTAAVLSDLPNSVRVYSPLFVSQNSLLAGSHINIEQNGNNKESQPHVLNEESASNASTGNLVSSSEHQPTEETAGASVNYTHSIGENNAQTPSTNQSTLESPARVSVERNISAMNSFRLLQSYGLSGIEQPSNRDQIPSLPEVEYSHSNGPSLKRPRIEASEISATETTTSSDGLRLVPDRDMSIGEVDYRPGGYQNKTVLIPEISFSQYHEEDEISSNEWHLDDLFPLETHIDDIFPPETHIDDIFPPETHLYDLIPELNEAIPLQDTRSRN